jgi:DNA-binding NtrC family response regulator
LQTFLARPAEFDLILTDLTMPGLTGLELAKQVFALRPELPVVLTTGFGGDTVPDAMTSANIRKVLQKPLTPQGVAATVHDILQGRNGTPPA